MGRRRRCTFFPIITKELHDAATAIDILVHDHLIVGKDEHFSARKSGWLKGR